MYFSSWWPWLAAGRLGFPPRDLIIELIFCCIRSGWCCTKRYWSWRIMQKKCSGPNIFPKNQHYCYSYWFSGQIKCARRNFLLFGILILFISSFLLSLTKRDLQLKGNVFSIGKFFTGSWEIFPFYERFEMTHLRLGFLICNKFDRINRFVFTIIYCDVNHQSSPPLEG